MTLLICIIATAMYSAIFGAHIGKQMLVMFLTITLFIAFCYLIGYLTTPIPFTTHKF